ncbi:MAG: hypothetical protein V3W18_03385 [candidate division Zixibacteria bacterium]
MPKKYLIFVVFVAVIFILTACAKQPVQISELKHFPVDNLDGIISISNVEIDEEISSDGNGAIRISVPESTTVRLFESENIDVENARLVYQARIRSKDLEGLAYLEILCHFPGRGDFFSRDLQSPLTGTVDWTTEETFFFLKKGDNPDIIKLNLVIGGKGTVWIDDIHLLKAPHQ